MNKKIIFSFALISTLLGCNAQQVQTRQLGDFDQVQISGIVNVIYTQSDTSSIVVKARTNELDKIETKVEKSKLIISSRGTFVSTPVVYVKHNLLNSVEVCGASSFKSDSELKGQSLNLNVSGSANINLRYTGHLINSEQSGASSIVLKGKVDSLVAEVAGASTFKSYALSSTHASVTTAGAASAKVFVTGTMRANATGASDIRIKGEPHELSAEASTAASISRIRENNSEGTGGNDTTNFNWKKRKIMVISTAKDDDEDEIAEMKKSNFKHWRGFSMGVNGYAGTSNGINLPKSTQFMELNYARSFNFQFNIIERQFNIVDDYFKIVTGFGFDYHLYEFANRTTLNPDTAFTWGLVDAASADKFVKNKLRCTYLQVPLLLEFNTNSDASRSFHLAAGVIGQYLISSRTKQEVEKDGVKRTTVKKDSYNLNPFAAKAHVNLGYRGWTIFAEYSLNSLFQPGKGPELYPFTAGIRLVPLG